MKKLYILLVVLTYGLTSSLAWATCANLSFATKWAPIDSHKIIMYQGDNAIAIIEIPFCNIFSSSDIKLINDVTCTGDKIVVDREACDVRSIEKQ